MPSKIMASPVSATIIFSCAPHLTSSLTRPAAIGCVIAAILTETAVGANFSPPALLLSQSNHGINSRRPHCRQQGGHHTGDQECRRRQRKGRNVERTYPVKNPRHISRQRDRSNQPD